LLLSRSGESESVVGCAYKSPLGGDEKPGWAGPHTHSYSLSLFVSTINLSPIFRLPNVFSSISVNKLREFPQLKSMDYYFDHDLNISRNTKNPQGLFPLEMNEVQFGIVSN
jgi:hypothetical protein